MRVLHLLDHSLPLISGYSMRTHNLLQAQSTQGILPLGLTSPKQGATGGCERIDGIPYVRTSALRMPVARKLALVPEMHLMLRVAQRAREWIEKHEVHLVHAHSPVLMGLPAYWAARRARIPVVYEIRAFWEEAAADEGTRAVGSAGYRLTRALETWLLRQVDAVGVISSGIGDEVRRRGVGEQSIFLTPNGVVPTFFESAGRDREIARRWQLEGRFVFGFIGSLRPLEGLDVLLRALAKVRQEVPDACVLVVGSGSSAPQLVDLAQRLGVDSSVRFTGQIRHEETPRYYSVCDALVYPRVRSRLTDLVTPLKPLEAMAAGKPVVASDVGGLRELIRDRQTGVFFPPGDHDALAGVLVDLARRPDWREELGACARQRVREERDWKVVSRATRETYDRLLGRSGEEGGTAPLRS